MNKLYFASSGEGAEIEVLVNDPPLKPLPMLIMRWRNPQTGEVQSLAFSAKHLDFYVGQLALIRSEVLTSTQSEQTPGLPTKEGGADAQ